MNMYITADEIGLPTGGGTVTYHEAEALKSLGPCEIWDRTKLGNPNSISRQVFGEEPWFYDGSASKIHTENNYKHDIKLAHFYAGTFSDTVARLQSEGVKVTYTAAAHDVNKSKKAHEDLGIPYDYPHLTDPKQWQRYVDGYLRADVLVCPSTHSRDVMRSYGAKNRIEVIPHGVTLPDTIAPLPPVFTVGYLGAIGPDKGVRYLLEAWRKLDYSPNEARLVLGGHHWISDFGVALIRQFGGQRCSGDAFLSDRTNLICCGWVNNISDFYNNISLYVQPSVSEGFGIEVLEAMAHGRSVLCSTGAGAVDLVPGYCRCEATNVNELAEKIDVMKSDKRLVMSSQVWKQLASHCTWDQIQQRYVKLWKELTNV